MFLLCVESQQQATITFTWSSSPQGRPAFPSSDPGSSLLRTISKSVTLNMSVGREEGARAEGQVAETI